MAYTVYLKQGVEGHTSFNLTSIDVIDGFLVKGIYRTPVENILYIKEV